MSTRGRKRSHDEKQLLLEVADAFSARKKKVGAKTAAKELNVSLASFYNYANGTDLPRMEVLRDAQAAWGVKWKLMDARELVKTEDASSPEQLLLGFLDTVRERDITVEDVKRNNQGALKVVLAIRFKTA